MSEQATIQTNTAAATFTATSFATFADAAEAQDAYLALAAEAMDKNFVVESDDEAAEWREYAAICRAWAGWVTGEMGMLAFRH